MAWYKPRVHSRARACMLVSMAEAEAARSRDHCRRHDGWELRHRNGTQARIRASTSSAVGCARRVHRQCISQRTCHGHHECDRRVGGAPVRETRGDCATGRLDGIADRDVLLPIVPRRSLARRCRWWASRWRNMVRRHSLGEANGCCRSLCDVSRWESRQRYFFAAGGRISFRRI